MLAAIESLNTYKVGFGYTVDNLGILPALGADLSRQLIDPHSRQRVARVGGAAVLDNVGHAGKSHGARKELAPYPRPKGDSTAQKSAH